MIKIAIVGKANSGKNTVGECIQKTLNNTLFKSMALADPIKEICKTMYPEIPRKFLYGPSKYRSEIIQEMLVDSAPLTVRQLLLDIGAIGRKYDINKWLYIAKYRIENLSDKYTGIIITDIRYRNEFNYFKENGFTTIKVYREQSLKLDHTSETSQNEIKDSEFDLLLNNNGTLPELQEKINNFILKYKN